MNRRGDVCQQLVELGQRGRLDLRSRRFCVRSLYVRSLRVRSLCVGSLCVGSFCVRSICVRSFCVGSLCVRGFDVRSLCVRGFDVRSFCVRGFDAWRLDAEVVELRRLCLGDFCAVRFDRRGGLHHGPRRRRRRDRRSHRRRTNEGTPMRGSVRTPGAERRRWRRDADRTRRERRRRRTRRHPRRRGLVALRTRSGTRNGSRQRRARPGRSGGVLGRGRLSARG